MIYFIHDVTSRTIKIGCAWNPSQRLSALQISTANKLVLLGSIRGMRREEKQVHGLVYRHCGQSPGDRPLCVSGEWFDDRILPFVTELISSPNTYLAPKPKKPAGTRPADGGLRECGIVLTAGSGETFREPFILKAATPEAALAALTDIAGARVAFLAHTVRITRLVVPGRGAEEVSLQGSFVTAGCNPREGLSVILNSEPGNGFSTVGGVKQYSDRWFHGVPTEFYGDETSWWFLGRVYTRPTDQLVEHLDRFARTLERAGCVIKVRPPLAVRGLLPRGIGSLPKGELRSKANQKAASRRRARQITDTRRAKHGVVYFIQDTVTTAVKIGFCLKKPEKRLAALQTGNSNPLRLVGHIPGSELHEKQLHQRFASLHIQGEWFSSPLLADLAGILECPSIEVWLGREGHNTLSELTAASAPHAGSDVGAQPPA